MSETKIVNRVAQTHGQKLEQARLELETTKLLPEQAESLQVVDRDHVEKAIEVLKTPEGAAAFVAADRATTPAGLCPQCQPDGSCIRSYASHVALFSDVQTTPAPVIDIGAVRREQEAYAAHEALAKPAINGRRAGELEFFAAQAEFQKNVIRAFKHLGLDTRQFFGQ